MRIMTVETTFLHKRAERVNVGLSPDLVEKALVGMAKAMV